MNYNYIMSTGSASLSGSRYKLEERNNTASKSQYYNIDYSVISGINMSRVSFNSQTLFQAQPFYYTGTSQVYIEAPSGDYYLDFSKQASKGKIFLDETLPVNNSGVVLYDKTEVDTGVLTMHTGGNPTGALNDLTEDLITQGLLAGGSTYSGDLFSGWDVFGNGQKFPSYDEFTGLDPQVTGKFFALRKPEKIFEYNSGAADSFGQKFIPNQVDAYINGTEQPISSFILTYTGVSLVEVGKSATAEIYKKETTSYNL